MYSHLLGNPVLRAVCSIVKFAVKIKLWLPQFAFAGWHMLAEGCAPLAQATEAEAAEHEAAARAADERRQIVSVRSPGRPMRSENASVCE